MVDVPCLILDTLKLKLCPVGEKRWQAGKSSMRLDILFKGKVLWEFHRHVLQLTGLLAASKPLVLTCKNPATCRHSETFELQFPSSSQCMWRNVHQKPHLRTLKITSIDFHPILCFIWRTCKEHLIFLLTVLLVKYILSTFITSIFLLNDDLAKWVILNDDTWGSEVALLLAFRARYHGGVHLVLHSPKGWEWSQWFVGWLTVICGAQASWAVLRCPSWSWASRCTWVFRERCLRQLDTVVVDGE